jgi:hypothetical protein
MHRRLLAAVAVGAAATLLSACGGIHPGAAIVINDGDYRASMNDVDDLTAALCEASPLLAEAQGQPAQTSEAIDARQYVVGLLIQSYLTPLAANQVDAAEPPPDQLTVSPADYTNITDQMSEDAADEFLQLIEMGTEVGAWQASIGMSQPNASPSTAAQAGLQYVLDYAEDFDIDIDPRIGMDGNDLQADKFARSGSISVAASGEATQREDPQQRQDVADSLPSSQACG